ncbi:methyltransferase domain-containing protein [Brevundimonas sp. 2R-24]|uniref:Methyltransferase domain-containing protein n=1 Tax=Peiella sedimenti TaxID=3061083 RepID=A0ABT8SMD8_9CAUL|nr:methyltransferase domain-containing protein [Caulobacteraceae bacterium XZ-24]
MSTVLPLVAGHTYETDVACAMCGSRRQHVLPPSANADMAKLREAWGCTFVECQDCGLRYYSPRLDETYAVQTYLEGGEAESEAISMMEKGVFFGEPEGGAEHQIALLKQLYTGIFDRICEQYIAANGRPPRTMFEVGTSVGWFSKAATERAIERWGRFETAGCDANVFSARMARERNGLNVQGCVFSAYKAAPEQQGHYDLIVAYDFLEHTYSPFTDLKKLHGLAAPKGMLAVKTFVDDLDPTGSMIHPVFHHHHFTRATLREIIERSGWRILEFDDTSEAVYAQVSVFAEKIG